LKILFLSRWFPYPLDNGSRIRIFNLINCLACDHEVDLVTFASEYVSKDRLAAMRRYCRTVEVIQYQSFRPYHWRAVLGFFSRSPRSVVDTYNVKMKLLVEELCRSEEYEVAIASEKDMAPYALLLQGRPRILEDLELMTLYDRFDKQRRLLEKLRNGLTWWKWASYISELLPAYDGVTVVSELERERVIQISPGYQHVEVIPNGADVAHYSSDYGTPEPYTLVYAGALTYHANFDAVDYFLREIYPLIQVKYPKTRLFITGRLDGVAVDQLPGNDGVIFTGYLDDIRPVVARSWVSVVPLRVGGGTRLKILESLALGTPVVTTNKGVEGLNFVSGRDLFVADEPLSFAKAVVRLFEDPALRARSGEAGRQAVKTQYDWQMIGRRFNRFVESVVNSGQ